MHPGFNWLTEETKVLMKQRDEWKDAAKSFAVENAGRPVSEDQISAWNKYKKLRNTINNRKKNEEIINQRKQRKI